MLVNDWKFEVELASGWLETCCYYYVIGVATVIGWKRGQLEPWDDSIYRGYASEISIEFWKMV